MSNRPDSQALAALRERLLAREHDPDAELLASVIDELRELRSMVEIAEQRLATIERQRLAIADLSAPIIDVWDGVLALPVVGLVDTQRSIEMTERLLQRIAESGAESVIVDLTGVDMVDTMTANHLLQMIRAASLLGAFSVLSGISPQIAQTLVQLEVELVEITTVRNLKEALKTCLRRRTQNQNQNRNQNQGRD
jgi:rsbT co-antagonist protein RsbR